MEKPSRLRMFNQFGYEWDAFDTYREAVDRSNRGAVKVLSALGLAIGGAELVHLIRQEGPALGLGCCAALMLAAALGLWICRGKNRKPGQALKAGYLVAACFYLLAIYGSAKQQADALWIGVQMVLCAYFLDYAWRVILLQAVSYGGMMAAWMATRGFVPTEAWMMETAFLVIGLVSFYALGRARLALIHSREESRQQTDTDLLTGLTVRSAAQEEIEEILAIPEERGVMMLLDLDRFKSVNDRLGHQKGDQVLVSVAADLRRMFRNTDVLSRLGGDEFLIFMRRVPEVDWAMQRAEQIVRETRRWVGDGTTNIQIAASVGIVMTETVERTYEELYRAADIAMYFAKAKGGNQAVLYTPELLGKVDQTTDTNARTEAKTLAEQNAAQKHE